VSVRRGKELVWQPIFRHVFGDISGNKFLQRTKAASSNGNWWQFSGSTSVVEGTSVGDAASFLSTAFFRVR
jgi:hypothetical protein